MELDSKWFYIDYATNYSVQPRCFQNIAEITFTAEFVLINVGAHSFSTE